MQKIRIIPTILFNEENIVKGKKFESWRKVGSLYQAIKIYNLREVDELIFLDINSTKKGNIEYKLIDDFADECFMPLTIGGGIKNIENIEMLLRSGADKVCINTAAFNDRNFITEAIKIFGSQCIIISIDYKKLNNDLIVFTHSGKFNTGTNLFKYLDEIIELAPGEIMLTSIDHDGMMNGYDINNLKKINANYSIPIIASGGAGNCEDFFTMINKTGIKAAAAASIYHFTEFTPLDVKKFLKNKDINVRI